MSETCNYGDEAQSDAFYSANEQAIAAFDNALARACTAAKKDAKLRRENLREVAAKYDPAFVADCLGFRLVAPHRELAEALAPAEPVKQAPPESEESDFTSSAVYEENHILRVMEDMNHKWAVVTLGSDTKLMREPTEVGKSPTFHGIDGFRNLYLNKRINVPNYGDGGGFKPMPVTKLWLEWPGRRTYEAGVIFEPDARKADPEAYNLWRGYPLDSKAAPGSWSLLRSHLLDNVCQGNHAHFTWVMTWLAQVVQQPGEKMGSSIAVRGHKGAGKSIVFDWVRKGMGAHAIKVSQKKHVVGEFNGHQKGVTLIVAEEAFWSGDPAAGSAIKDLITSDEMMFEQKGVDAVPISNYVRMAFVSNETWVVPASDGDERRYFVLECGDDQRGNIPYFLAIIDQMKSGGLAAMWHELHTWDVKKHYPEEGWNILRTPPVTEGLQQQAETGRAAWDRFFVGFIEDGKLEARSNPDLPEIELEEADNWIPVADLRAHFDAEMDRTRTQEAGRYRNNRGALLKLAEKWLGVTGPSENHHVKGAGGTVKAYRCPPLSTIRALAVARGVTLDVPAEPASPRLVQRGTR